LEWQLADYLGKRRAGVADNRRAISITSFPAFGKTACRPWEDGVSQKAAGAGHASHYISLTRIHTSGFVELGEKKFEVPGQVGWITSSSRIS